MEVYPFSFLNEVGGACSLEPNPPKLILQDVSMRPVGEKYSAMCTYLSLWQNNIPLIVK